jgi:hypothetical protein
MSNPFRHPLKRKQFDMLIAAFEQKDKMLFTRESLPHRNNSFAASFWAGYNGLTGGLFHPDDPKYREMAAYVFYRAGQECHNKTETAP